jgi:hypothetical protein
MFAPMAETRIVVPFVNVAEFGFGFASSNVCVPLAVSQTKVNVSDCALADRARPSSIESVIRTRSAAKTAFRI